MLNLRKPKAAIVLAIATAAATAAVLGVTQAFTSDSSGNRVPQFAEPQDIAVPEGETPVIHGTQQVDGQTWLVKTYPNSDGQLCFAEQIPGEGEGIGCRSSDEFFKDGPVWYGVGSRQLPGSDPTRWSNIWVDGLVDSGISKVVIVMTDCSTLPVPVDSDGVFLAVFGRASIEAGVWPATLVAFDSAGQPVEKYALTVGAPPTDAAKSAGIQAPQPKNCT